MTVSESGWKAARIRSELRSQIEDAVSTIKIRNMAKYDSVSDFVEKACIALLDKEKVEISA